WPPRSSAPSRRRCGRPRTPTSARWWCASTLTSPATSRATAATDSTVWRGRSTARSRSSPTTPTARATKYGCAAARPREPLMTRARPSRISQARLLADLKVAAKRGDRTALSLALDQMRTLAHSPRYWEKYLHLLSSPLARLVDLLVIKQGDRIAAQKGWKLQRPKAAGGAGQK